MTGFYGADTDALRTLADRFRDGSTRLEELRTRLEPLVLNEGIWSGPDAEAFRNTWSSEVGPRFASVVDEVGRRRKDLTEQADEQDDASDGDGGAGDGGGGLLDKIMDAARIGVKAYSLYKTSSTIMRGVDDVKRLMDAAKLGPDDAKRVWESLKLRNWMEFDSGGFGKLMKSIGGKATDLVPGDVWKWMGNKVDDIPAKLGEGGKLIEKIGSKLGPDGLSALGKASKVLGKAVPVADIVVGGAQIATADDGYGKVSGGLSMAGGTLMLAGVVCPPLAVVGGVMTGASLVMDLADMGGELFGADPSKAVSDAVSSGVDKVKDVAGDVGGSIKKGLGSIF